ncbi:helix-turn-helix transcriptional regulator [Streptomyces sp. NPDC051286]|uniref:helix-turn-helix transcriptional regulator n=1 Tax=Streptomyces sp. NPDC051286 TaxID=3365647 RepID=UPI0037B8EA98
MCSPARGLAHECSQYGGQIPRTVRLVPLRPDPPKDAPRRSPAITSDLQRTILPAVVGGETDASIARRLGMSRRSVAEHMRTVSEQLGSNSRAQLGHPLATSGLLDS